MINVAACLTGPDAVPAEGEALICVIYNYDAPPAWQAVFTQLGADPGKWAAYRRLSDTADQPLPSWEGPGPAWPCPLPGPVLPGWEGVASRAFMSPRPLRGGRGFPGGSQCWGRRCNPCSRELRPPQAEWHRGGGAWCHSLRQCLSFLS